jgi:hypothetical protein
MQATPFVDEDPGSVHAVAGSQAARRFLVCIHDASPACAGEIRLMVRDLAPLVGRCLSFGVVPDWHGAWPLQSYPDFCRLVSRNSEELLLHGYHHRRRRGAGIITSLTNGSDEMNGLDADQTQRTLERGQRVFTEVFGEPARGFLAPGWQRGRVRTNSVPGPGLDHVLGFFSLDSFAGRSVSLATRTWDCGRWDWLGHVGHAIGWALQWFDGRVPVLAIHPRDIERGFWPKILRLTRELCETGCEPSTAARLLETDGHVATGCAVAARVDASHGSNESEQRGRQ